MALLGTVGEGTVEGTAFVAETGQRLSNLEGRAGAFDIKISALEIGVAAAAVPAERPAAAAATFEQHRVKAEAGINEAFTKIQEFEEALKTLDMRVISRIINEKIKTATELQGQGSRADRTYNDFEFNKPILESKAINDLPECSEANTYKDWNQRFKNAME